MHIIAMLVLTLPALFQGDLQAQFPEAERPRAVAHQIEDLKVGNLVSAQVRLLLLDKP
jgi:hypothetical protein